MAERLLTQAQEDAQKAVTGYTSIVQREAQKRFGEEQDKLVNEVDTTKNLLDPDYYKKQANKLRTEQGIIKQEQQLPGDEMAYSDINSVGKTNGWSDAKTKAITDMYNRSRNFKVTDYENTFAQDKDNMALDIVEGLGKSVFDTVSGMAETGQNLMKWTLGKAGIDINSPTVRLPEYLTEAEGTTQEVAKTVGDIAQFFIPGSKIAKGKKFVEGLSKAMLNKGFKRGLANLTGKTAVESGVDTAILALQEGDDTTIQSMKENLMWTAAFGGLIEGIAPVAGAAKKYFNPNAKTEILTALNPNIRTKATVERGLEDVLHALVLDGRKTIKGQATTIWNEIKEKGIGALPEALTKALPRKIESADELLVAVNEKKGDVWKLMTNELKNTEGLAVKGDEILETFMNKLKTSSDASLQDVKNIIRDNPDSFVKEIKSSFRGQFADNTIPELESLRAKANAASGFNDVTLGLFNQTDSKTLYRVLGDTLGDVIDDRLASIGGDGMKKLRNAYSKLAAVSGATYTAKLKALGKEGINFTTAMNAPQALARMASGQLVGGLAQIFGDSYFKAMKALDTKITNGWIKATKKFTRGKTGAILRSPLEAIGERFGRQLDDVSPSQGIGEILEVLNPTAQDIKKSIATSKPLGVVIEERIKKTPIEELTSSPATELPIDDIVRGTPISESVQASTPMMDEAMDFSRLVSGLSDVELQKVKGENWFKSKVKKLQEASEQLQLPSPKTALPTEATQLPLANKQLGAGIARTTPTGQANTAMTPDVIAMGGNIAPDMNVVNQGKMIDSALVKLGVKPKTTPLNIEALNKQQIIDGNVGKLASDVPVSLVEDKAKAIITKTDGNIRKFNYKDGKITISDKPNGKTNAIGINNIQVGDKGKGTGTEIMNKLFDLAKKEYPNKDIIVYAEGDRAINFYKKNGFTVDGKAERGLLPMVKKASQTTPTKPIIPNPVDDIDPWKMEKKQDIYNDVPKGQVKGKSEMTQTSLVEDKAKKYKSADEFVKKDKSLKEFDEDYFFSKNSKPITEAKIGEIPSSRFDGDDIRASQNTTTEKGISLWKKRIEKGEKPFILVERRLFPDTGNAYNAIIDGHHRLEAYLDLGIDNIPVIDITGLTGRKQSEIGGYVVNKNIPKIKDIYNKANK